MKTPPGSPVLDSLKLGFAKETLLEKSSSESGAKGDGRSVRKESSLASQDVCAIRVLKDNPLRGVGSYEDGLLHVGQFRWRSAVDAWCSHGETTVFFKEGEQWTPCYKGPRCYGAFAVLSLPKNKIKEQMGGPLFLSSLLGSKSLMVCDSAYFAGILCFYCRKKGYRKLAQSFLSLYKGLLVDETSLESREKKDKQIQKIFQGIDKGEILLPYGYRAHATVLKIVKQNPDKVNITIYDSNGFDDQYAEGGKRETAWRTQIPRSSWTPQLTASIVDYYTVEEKKACQLFTSIEGAHRLHLRETLLQAPQKSGNCAIECFFAYLKNTMKEPAYTKFRLELFRECWFQLQINPSVHPRQKKEFSQELERKIAKRESKLRGCPTINFRAV